MKKVLLTLTLILTLSFPLTVKAYDICNLGDGSVEVKSEYVEGTKYVVNVVNDSATKNATVRVTVSYKLGTKDGSNNAVEIARSLSTTKIEIPIPEGATNVQVVSITGTKCNQ